MNFKNRILKQLVLGVLVSFTALVAQSSFAETREAEAKNTITSFLSDHLGLVSLPKNGGKFFYTICSTGEAGLVYTQEGGDCVEFSIDGAGQIEYLPMKIRSGKVGAAVGATMSLTSLHRIKGVKTLQDVEGWYLFLSSNVGIIGGARETFFTIKLSFSEFAGDYMDGDASWAIAEANVISLGILHYSIHDYSEIQTLKLSTKSLSFLKK